MGFTCISIMVGIPVTAIPTRRSDHVHMPWFNLGTVAAFLAWFGGTGYLLMQYSTLWFGLALVLATVSGLGGASIVFLFLARVLMKHDKPLDHADYEMVGVLGRLSSPIRAGGTGEIIYTQAGTRRVAGARAEERRRHCQRRRSRSHAIRKRHRLRSSVGRTDRRSGKTVFGVRGELHLYGYAEGSDYRPGVAGDLLHPDDVRPLVPQGRPA